MGLFNNDMTGLAAAYASMNDGKYLLTNADKVGNTPAWQNRYRVNESTGEMLYEMADHLKEAYEEELIAQLDETLAELARLDEGKMPAGLQAYIDKKKGGKKEKEENGDDNGKSSKGSKPDFLDLDKDGDKKEPMKKAAKEKKEETEYNYVNAYAEMMAPRMQKGAMAYDGPNKAASEAKDRVMQKAKDKMKKEEYVDEKVIGADTTMRMMAAKDRMKGKDKLLSKKEGDANAANMKAKIKMSPSYAGAMGEELIKSGVFTEEEITKFIWVEFDESREYRHNPQKYHDSQGRDKKLEMDKPYAKRSRAARRQTAFVALKNIKKFRNE